MSDDISLQEAKEFAISLAKEAGKILQENFGKIKEIEHKTKQEMVTNVDKEVDAFIRGRIKEKYPDHHILIEESGENDVISEYMWIVDPLDGTHNYIYGYPLYGVSIALAKDKKPILGVIYLPVTDELFYAEKGKGAFRNNKKILVSTRGLDDEAIMTFDTNFSDKEGSIGQISRLLDVVKRVRLVGSAVFNLSYTAMGVFDLRVCKTVKPWDIAAGCLIVEEAGGKVTDWKGNPWNINMSKLIVSNGKFHERIVEILKND